MPPPQTLLDTRYVLWYNIEQMTDCEQMLITPGVKMKSALVDLSTSKVTVTQTSAELLKRFLGGRGLGAKLLFDSVGPDVDPLSPENYLIFTTGPLTGTPWPTSARLRPPSRHFQIPSHGHLRLRQQRRLFRGRAAPRRLRCSHRYRTGRAAGHPACRRRRGEH